MSRQNEVEIEGAIVGTLARAGLGIAFFCPRCGQQWARVPGVFRDGEGPLWYSVAQTCRLHPDPVPSRVHGSLVSSDRVQWLREDEWPATLRRNPDWLYYEFLIHLDWFESL